MKVSLNLAQEYSNVDLKSIPHDVLLKRVGAQLGAVEETVEYAPRYKGVVVAKIVTVEDHPNADRLHVCMIDDGKKVKGVKRNDDGLVQVVCGAPNVRPGLFVAWLPPKSTVPSSYDDEEPFVLSARELRGVVSNGMLASAKELGISDDHDGILEILSSELRREPKPGEDFVNYFHLDDFIIDCENKMFTHRPDCFGNLGVARELAGISGLKFKSPDWYLAEPRFKTKSEVKIEVKNTIPKLVPRIMAVAMNGVRAHKSPVWLQALLARVGIKSINTVVDITNYISWLTGQPLHAYDADKLQKVASQQVSKSASLEVRMSKKGEKLNLLNGKTLTLEDNKDIVITSHDVPVGLGGIMGGSDTEVDEHTRTILIECATFDMYTIRRSSMRHGLFTDASTRYTKGQSPLQNDRVVAYAMQLLQQLAHAGQASSVMDVHNNLEHPADVEVDAQFINERLGSDLSLHEIAKLLENVEFEIKSVPADKNRLHVRPPFWRTDIELPEDIVEEVGRLHGFDSLPQVLPPRSAKAAIKDPSLSLKRHIRMNLRKAGANEVLTYNFVHGGLLNKMGQDVEKAYHIRNAISPDLQYYRLSVLPSLLDKVQQNIRSDMVRSDDNEFAMFEIGKAHNKLYSNPNRPDHEKGIPDEVTTVSLVFAADDKTAKRKYEGAPYYQARAYLQSLLDAGSLNGINLEPLEGANLYGNEWLSELVKPFEPSRSAVLKDKDGLIWGVVGEFCPPVLKALKLPSFTAGFEVDIGLFAYGAPKYKPLSVFPKVQQDMTYEVEGAMPFSMLYEEVLHEFDNAKQEHGIDVVVEPRDVYKEQGSNKKRITLRVWMSHPSRTLTTDETNRVLDVVSDVCSQKLSAERI